jgi:membrane protein YqaA with SNARE-associated domain
MALTLRTLWIAVERFAHARGAVPATFLWNLGQGSVVPGPAELLLVPLAVADPRRAWRLAAAAMVGAVLGGIIAYRIGVVGFASIGKPLLDILGVSDRTLAEALSMMAKYGWLFVLGSTLTPLSTKVTAIAAGASAMPFPLFALTLIAGRALRFSAIVLLLQATAGGMVRLRERFLRA